MEEQITSFLYSHSDTGLVVIDTLQKVRSCDQSGSMYASDYKDVSALKSLADKYGICILLIHHLRKRAASDPLRPDFRVKRPDGGSRHHMGHAAQTNEQEC